MVLIKYNNKKNKGCLYLKSIDIVLTSKDNYKNEHLIVDFLGALDESVINELINISNDRIRLSKLGNKLQMKKNKAIRQARKIVNQFAKSRQIEYDEKTKAIGITKDDIIYVGDKDKLKENPTVEPDENDVIKGKLTKSEKKLYVQSIEGYVYINNQIVNYMSELNESEVKLISFEKSLLKDKEYSIDSHYLLVSLVDGKTYLCKNKEDVSVSEKQKEE